MEIAIKMIFIVSALTFGGLVSFGIYCIALALINRERSARAVVESEIKFRSLFDAIKDAIIVIDLETLSIVETNKEAVEIFGYSKNEFTQMAANRLFPKYSPKQTRTRFEELLGRPPDNDINESLVCADGTELPVNIKATFGTINGRGIVIAIIRDMCEISKARIEIAEKIEDLKNVIGFLSGRELKMIELKEEVNRFLTERGEKPKYSISD